MFVVYIDSFALPGKTFAFAGGQKLGTRLSGDPVLLISAGGQVYGRVNFTDRGHQEGGPGYWRVDINGSDHAFWYTNEDGQIHLAFAADNTVHVTGSGNTFTFALELVQPDKTPMGSKVLVLMSELGHMCADPTYLSHATGGKVAEVQLDTLFQNVINEHHSSSALYELPVDTLSNGVTDYFNGVRADKSRLIGEMSAEAAAAAVAAAAQIAALAGSWIPFVNFALEATAVAALAAQMGLQVDVSNLKHSVVEKITNSNAHILQRPEFAPVRTFQAAVDANVHFVPQLQVANTDFVRPVLLATCIGSVKCLRENRMCQPGDIRAELVLWYNWYNSADQDLVQRFKQLLDQISENPVPDAEAVKTQLAGFLESINSSTSVNVDLAKKAASVTAMTLTAFLMVKAGRAWYATYRAVTSVTSPLLGAVELNRYGSVAQAGELEGEAAVISRGSLALKALGGLAAAASLVLAGLEIFETVDTSRKLDEAISSAETEIQKYYRALTNSAAEGNPTPGQQATINTTGVVIRVDLEGGFYAIQGDDGKHYDPLSSLPADFHVPGIKIRFAATPKRVMTTHMWGTTITILELSQTG